MFLRFGLEAQGKSWVTMGSQSREEGGVLVPIMLLVEHFLQVIGERC